MKSTRRLFCMLLAFCLGLGLLLNPAFTFSSAHPFTDVVDTEWYSDAVQYVYEHGLM